MTLALRSPKQLKALVPVDNAPVNATLKSDFSKYVQGLQEVERAKVAKQIDADEILRSYEKVGLYNTASLFVQYRTKNLLVELSESRHWPYGNFCSPISFEHQGQTISGCEFLSMCSPRTLNVWAISPSKTRTKHDMKARRSSYAEPGVAT